LILTKNQISGSNSAKKIKKMIKIFNNTHLAFALKSDSELDRAYFLFKIIDNRLLVRIGTAVTNFAIKLKLPVEKLIRVTVLTIFVEVLMKRIV
jgi:proline dehydrogenase